jgi:RNA polymerase sigma-70 factor (ECF subfamily)
VEDAHQESETDAALVALARQGDARAFEQLVRRHLRVAYAVALRQVGNADDADDVVQDAFVRALERLEDCREPERFRAWLLTIVRNRGHNLRAREAVRAADALDSVRGLADRGDTARRVEEREFREGLEAALAQLTELQRNVFVLFDMEGLDHREVAERLGISRSSSRFNLHVARRALRERLDADLPMAWRR